MQNCDLGVSFSKWPVIWRREDTGKCERGFIQNEAWIPFRNQASFGVVKKMLNVTFLSLFGTKARERQEIWRYPKINMGWKWFVDTCPDESWDAIREMLSGAKPVLTKKRRCSHVALDSYGQRRRVVKAAVTAIANKQGVEAENEGDHDDEMQEEFAELLWKIFSASIYRCMVSRSLVFVTRHSMSPYVTDFKFCHLLL